MEQTSSRLKMHVGPKSEQEGDSAAGTASTHVDFLPLADVSDEPGEPEQPDQGEQLGQAEDAQGAPGVQDLKALRVVLKIRVAHCKECAIDETSPTNLAGAGGGGALH